MDMVYTTLQATKQTYKGMYPLWFPLGTDITPLSTVCTVTDTSLGCWGSTGDSHTPHSQGVFSTMVMHVYITWVHMHECTHLHCTYHLLQEITGLFILKFNRKTEATIEVGLGTYTVAYVKCQEHKLSKVHEKEQ